MSFADFEAKAEQHKPKAAFLVHIGGHIAFDVEQIADYCAEHGIFLIEDCAHAHGASWNGRGPGHTATPASTRCTRPRRSRPARAACWSRSGPRSIEHARAFRNYGKPTLRRPRPQLPHERVHRRARTGADRAAAGDRRVEERGRARRSSTPSTRAGSSFPTGMISGLYKYIVFDWLERSTGRVYDEPCHRILGHDVELPNSDWVARNHSCVPLYYRPRTTGRYDTANEGLGHRRIGLHRLARGRQAPRARARARDL